MQILLRLLSAVLLAGALSSCGTRGTISLLEGGDGQGATLQPVLVATSRAPSPAPEYFSSARAFDTSFARFDVSIPPDREPGSIRYPKGQPDPRRDFVVTEVRSLDGPRAFLSEVNAAALRLPGSGRTGVVFVHGFNNNFAESLYKDVQLRHDLKSPGVGVLFTWPSAAKPLAYVADRESALFSRDALAETLSLMSRSSLTGYNVVAHSMGTFLTMETLRALALVGDRATLARINAVILISADLEIDIFRKQAPAILAAGVPIYLLVADDDKALRVSAVVRSESKRLGAVRSTAELGGLDVRIVDLSALDSDDATGHLKVGSSPEIIAFIQRIRDSGVAIFDDGQKSGILDHGAVFVQGATGLILNPLAN